MDFSSSNRRAALLAAEARANALFDAIEQAGLIAPGRDERAIEDAIYALAERSFGVTRHWHKRIVRSGPNTITTAADNPPNRVVGSHDPVYIDLGPVFEGWEADIGRTYVLGDYPPCATLPADLEHVFAEVQAHYHMRPAITGAELYAFAQDAAKRAGWIFGGAIAGHIISEFAHAQIPGDKELNRISPRNTKIMREPDAWGRERHWILEIHLVDSARTFGGFYERLL